MIPIHYLTIIIFLVLGACGAMLLIEGLTDFFVLFAKTVGSVLRRDGLHDG